MDVYLIERDDDAINRLIFTKNVRLSASPEALDEIRQWPYETKLAELRYMANTIPSSWEFFSLSFVVLGVSRAFTHQFVRTRAASYAQQSMRVTDMGDYEFIVPERLAADEEAVRMLDLANDAIRYAYRSLLEAGHAPEDARSILPTNISTNIVARYTMRSFVEMARSRLGGRTQAEYRNVVAAMCEAAIEAYPWMEYFLYPEGREHFREIEEFAEKVFGGDLGTKGELLKIVDAMRKERK